MDAITSVATELHELHKSISNANNNAILQRLAEMETRLMSKLGDQLQAIRNHQDETDIEIDKLVEAANTQATATQGLAGDIEGLFKKIEELQNSQGGVTPEDQVLIDEAQARALAARDKVKAVAEAAAAQAAALQALDDKTPPVVPNP